MLDFTHNNLTQLLSGKMKYKTGVVAIEEFAGLKQRMYSFLVEDWWT